MGTGEDFAVEHVRKTHTSTEESLAGEPGNHHFWHRGMWLADQVQVLRWIALPLLGDQPEVTFHECVLGTMSSASRKRPHHGLIDDDAALRFGLQLFLLLLWLWTHRQASSNEFGHFRGIGRVRNS